MLKKLLLLGGAVAAVSAGSAAYADTVAAEAADMTSSIETVVVLGTGETRQVESISQQDIETVAPGTSPIKAISGLPGVNYQASDPYGAYEWGVRVSVRSFNQNQMGFTLDDMPLGDMSYGNYNGLHISRAVSPENIGVVELAQGTGALGTASTSNLGGTLAFHSIAPKEDFGIYVTTSYGDNSALHEFARIDSGVLPGGGSGFVSYGFQQSDKWKGDGLQKQQLINAKYVQPIGTAAVSGFFDYSVRRETDYQDLSLALIKRVGYKWDNISDDWKKAVAVATVYQANPGGDCAAVGGGDGSNAYPVPFQCVDDAYYNASGLRNDAIGGLTMDWPILDNLVLHVTGYGHNNKGMGTWDTPYVATPGGAPISRRTTEYGINRYGAITTLTWTLEDHTVEAGYWYENNNFHQARRFYGLDLDSPLHNLTFPKNPFYTQWEYKFNTVTHVFHIEDTWRITDALKLNFGFKTQKVNNAAHPIVGSIGGKIGTDTGFLPQAGVNYTLDEHNELFADFARNQRAFVSAGTSGPFSTTQAGFDAIKDKLKPETSNTFEGGYRYNGGNIQGLLAVYDVKFKNRLLATTVGSGIQGNPSALSNVGSVSSYGIEAAGTWHFTDTLWLFGSYAYNHAVYDDDTYNGDGNLVAKTKDKTITDAPRHMLKGQFGYDDGTFFGHLDGSYMSKRYYTYTNDGAVRAQTLFDLTLGYRLHRDDCFDGSEIQLNVTNLFDVDYISTIGSNGYVNSDPNGSFQTMQAGAPQQVTLTLRKQF
jgi:iron complex outermembrane recepter protein